MMTERYRFEAWANSRGLPLEPIVGGEYWHEVAEEVWQAWQARCPEGWQCVPVEPTEEMTDSVMWATQDNTARCIYIDMLAASPHPGEE